MHVSFLWCCALNRSTTIFMMRLTTTDSTGGAAMVLARVDPLTMAGWSEQWTALHLLGTFGGTTTFGHVEELTQRSRSQMVTVWKRTEAKNRRRMRPRKSIQVRTTNWQHKIKDQKLAVYQSGAKIGQTDLVIKLFIHSAKSAGGRLQINAHAPYMCGFNKTGNW